MLNFPMGFIADIDFGSEKIRCLGNLRFDVCAYLTVCCPKSRNAEVVAPQQIAWKQRLHQDNKTSLKSEPNYGSIDSDVKQTLLVKQNNELDEIVENSEDTDSKEAMDFTIRGKVYLANFTLFSHLSRGVNICPELTLDSE